MILQLVASKFLGLMREDRRSELTPVSTSIMEDDDQIERLLREVSASFERAQREPASLTGAELFELIRGIHAGLTPDGRVALRTLLVKAEGLFSVFARLMGELNAFYEKSEESRAPSGVEETHNPITEWIEGLADGLPRTGKLLQVTEVTAKQPLNVPHLSTLRRMAQLLAQYVDADRVCTPPAAHEVARKLNMSRSTVQNAFGYLLATGWLEELPPRRRMGKAWRRKAYRVLLPSE